MYLDFVYFCIAMSITVRLILVLVLLMAGLSGCTPASTREALASADSIMATAPDSALTILDAIDPATLHSDEKRARYALLLTEARHMADVPVYDDSLISVATDYYLIHGAPEEKARAFYYSAIVKHANSNYEQSIVDGLRAEKHALTTSDHLRLGLVYRTIADCFDCLYDWSSALHYYKLSYEEFCKAQSDIYANWALIDISRIAQMKDDYDLWLSCGSRARDYAEQVGDSVMLGDALRILANGFLGYEKPQEARLLYGRVMDLGRMAGTDYGKLGQVYIDLDDADKAAVYLDSLRAYDIADNTLEIRLAEYRKDYEKAYELLSSDVVYQNKEFSKVIGRNYARTISEYYGLEEKASMEQVSKSRISLISVIVITTILFVFAYLFFRYRTSLLNRQIEARISEAQNLEKILFEKSSELDDMTTSRDELVNKLSRRDAEFERIREEARKESSASAPAIARDEIRHLLAGRFEHIDRLCSVYFQFKGKSNEKDRISAEVLEIINGIQFDCKIQAKLEETINDNLENVMLRFRKDFPSIKERDYMLFMFLILDFSPRAISILQDLKTEVVYNHKSKLKRKIAASDSEYVTEYLSYIR